MSSLTLQISPLIGTDQVEDPEDPSSLVYSDVLLIVLGPEPTEGPELRPKFPVYIPIMCMFFFEAEQP